MNAVAVVVAFGFYLMVGICVALPIYLSVMQCTIYHAVNLKSV